MAPPGPQVFQLCRQLVDNIRDLTRVATVRQGGEDGAHCGIGRNAVGLKFCRHSIQEHLLGANLLRRVRRPVALKINATDDQGQLGSKFECLLQRQPVSQLVQHCA